MNEWVLVGVGLLLTVGTGLFVAAEFALVNLDRHDLETRQERGEKGLGPTITALRTTATQLSSAQLGITLTTLLTGYTFEPALASLLEDPLGAVGLSSGAATGVGSVLGVLLATLFSMVVGELVPKNFALAVPARTAKLVVPFQLAFTTAFRPVIAVLNRSANAVVRRLGVEPQEELSGARSAEELSFLIRHSARAGVLEADDATLLHRTLDFAERDAADLMTPRVRMSAVPATATAADVVTASAASGHSRLPVLGDGPDDVVGFVHVKHAFAVDLERRDDVVASELMTPPVHVPATLGAAGLLETLREHGLQLAVVTDEYGGTAGVVTLEDLVEEIVGELEDEHDRAAPGSDRPTARRGRSFAFDAAWRPDELLARAGVAVATGEEDRGDYDTVGGFVLHRLQRLPEVGDEVVLADGALRVERTDGHAVARLRWIPGPDPRPAGQDGEAS